MEIVNALVEAQQGNYQSYELLLQQIQATPSLITSLFLYISTSSNPTPSRELVAIFLKNLLKTPTFYTWWCDSQEKPSIVQSLLEHEEIYKVTSLILSSILGIESSKGEGAIFPQILACRNKCSVLGLGYFIENSRTVPPAVRSGARPQTIPAVRETPPPEPSVTAINPEHLQVL